MPERAAIGTSDEEAEAMVRRVLSRGEAGAALLARVLLAHPEAARDLADGLEKQDAERCAVVETSDGQPPLPENPTQWQIAAATEECILVWL